MSTPEQVLAPTPGSTSLIKEAGCRHALQEIAPSARLFKGATRFLAFLALEGRIISVCAALIVNMTAFSLWWMLCYWLDTHGLWLYLPALLLAHPLALLVLGSKLSTGALIAANRRGEPSGVELERLARSLPPIEILRGDEGLLLKRLRR
ncbi:MAG: hypothetical protein JXA37_12145 [Chloroflexia bacterium]|nr:hypothetical protein [Chloroflexia bacterium]